MTRMVATTRAKLVMHQTLLPVRSRAGFIPTVATTTQQTRRHVGSTTSTTCTCQPSISGKRGYQHALTSSLTERTTRTLSVRPLRAKESEDIDNDIVEFGYSRKDVILLCTLPLIGGYATYYGLQKFLGLNPIQAGNYVQVIFVFILCVGWCGTYLFRVGTKNMTYTQQLKDYEEAVMEKRLEEMSESEIENILNQGKPEPSEAEGP